MLDNNKGANLVVRGCIVGIFLGVIAAISFAERAVTEEGGDMLCWLAMFSPMILVGVFLGAVGGKIYAMTHKPQQWESFTNWTEKED